MSLAVEMVGVEKRFPQARGLDGLDLRIARGAVFGVLGPNGAGKTTTLRVLLGLLAADRGTVRVLGYDPVVEGRRVRAEVGVLLENDGLYDRMSAIANLEYHARIQRIGAEAPSRIEEILRSFDLWDRRRDPVATWSRGMRQKLAIGRALLHRPKLLLLDEPFTGLDPAAAVELRDRIGELTQKAEVTVVMTTHDLAHVEKSCTDVAVIQSGRVIAAGAPRDIGRADGHDVFVRGRGLSEAVLEPMKRSGLIQSFRVRKGTDDPIGTDAFEAEITCSTQSRARLGVELVERGVEIWELRSLKGSLEEAFLSIVGAAPTPESNGESLRA